MIATHAVRAALLASALALAGCSGGQVSEQEANRDAQFAALTRLLPLPGIGPRAEPAAPMVVIDADPGQRLAAELASRNAQAQLWVVGRNGPVTTWQTADSITVSLAAPGVVLGTRGLGEDLHVADVAATAAALTAGRGAEGLRRTHRTLDGGQRLVSAEYLCTLRPAGSDMVQVGQTRRAALRFDETCRSADGDGFTNHYWRAPDRAEIVASHQWLGPELGSISLTLLAQ